ncbi:MAG: hypothetical protein ABIQ63_12100 [Rhodanobacter sp.]
MSNVDAGSKGETTSPFPEPVFREDLAELAKWHLRDHLDMPGEILYSSHKTLQPGDVYLIGFNPGGREGTCLGESIYSTLGRTNNAYCDEAWERDGKTLGKGTAPLQQRVRWLLTQLGKVPTAVCASNLIFMQSRKADEVRYPYLADRCWPIHKAILGIVKPKVIVAFGNSKRSAFEYLHHRLGKGKKIDKRASGHGQWKLKSFSTQLNGKDIRILGIPHLSRYSPDREEFYDWLPVKEEFNRWLLKDRKEVPIEA